MTIIKKINKRVQAFREKEFILDILVVHYIAVVFFTEFNEHGQQYLFNNLKTPLTPKQFFPNISDKILFQGSIIQSINKKTPISNRLLALKNIKYNLHQPEYINGSLISLEHTKDILEWLNKHPKFLLNNHHNVVIGKIKPNLNKDILFSKKISILDALCETGSTQIINQLISDKKINTTDIAECLNKKLMLTDIMHSFLEAYLIGNEKSTTLAEDKITKV